MFKKTAIATAVFLAATAHAQMVGTGATRTTIENYAVTKYLSQTGVPAAWARGFTGRGSIVAVLDQGFDLTQADIKNNVLAFKNFQAGSTVLNWGLHGTQMASIVAAQQNGWGTVGVAPDAKLLLGQIGNGGTSSYINTSAMIQGMYWAEANGANVISLSLGSSYDATFQSKVKQLAPGVWQAPANYGSLYGQTYFPAYAAASKSAVLVAAAGNQGLGYAAFPGAFATQVDSAGNLVLGGRALIVGSVGAGNVISSFSNKAGSLCTNVVGTTCADKYQVKDFYVVAPGELIMAAVPNQKTAGNTTTTVSGTSPATAYVSGGIALMHQAWPQMKAAQLVQQVLNTTTDLGKAGTDEVYGRGLVNFDKATRPIGNLVYTTASLNGTAPTAKTAQIGVVATGTVATALKSSSVLANTQMVDGIGRNYAVNLTGSVGFGSSVNSLATSPYLAMNATYREFAVPVGKTDVLTFMQSENGVAAQYETDYKDMRVSLQTGAMSEKNGFLNSFGAGMTGFGNSGTTWAMVGATAPIAHTLDVVASYGIGVTRTGNAAESLISLSPTMISDTWKLGLAKKDIFFAGTTQDKLTFAVQGPVSVRKGYADVTAVTGYSYTSDANGDITANPEISKERVNLAKGVRETDLVVGYSVQVKNTTYFGASIARQFNAGGNPGVQGTAFAVTARSVF